MSSFSVLELVELSDGEIVLKHPDEGKRPLVRIRFSREIRDMMGEDALAVAEVMIEAATDYIAGIGEDGDESPGPGSVLH